MKLSKQERIGAIVIMVIVILAIGIFIFIKPRFETINASRVALEKKQSELQAAKEKAATKEGLKTQVLEAFEEGENLADMFFEEMNSYQAEEEFRAFLEQCGANVIVSAVSVGNKGVSTLAPTFFEEKEVVYPLKTYATSGVAQTEEELAAANRLAILKEKLGGSQQVGSITVTFDIVAIDHEEFIKFCEAVNNYQKDEAGGKTRKACMLNGFTFEYPLVEIEYNTKKSEIEQEAKTAGLKELYKKFNKTYTEEDKNTEDKEAELNVSDYIYTVSTSMTFYSVARMQDPTDQLDAQDGIAF
ncbi:MAG: hypothetical protein ACI4Q4_05730 [Oscillospiraceae bacterium]